MGGGFKDATVLRQTHVSKMATSASYFNQSVQHGSEAGSPKKPSMEVGFVQARAQSQETQAISS